MAIWLIRAGKFGEHEARFIEEKTVYCTWDNIDWDMSTLKDRSQFKDRVKQAYPDAKEGTINSHVGQLWAFSQRIAIGDIVALPSKIKPVVFFGKVTATYAYSAQAEIMYRHSLKVEWVKEVNRKDVAQDILYSLGSVLTICQIARNNAEQRLLALLGKVNTSASQMQAMDDNEDAALEVDIEDAARQEISDKIISKFKGHGLSKVVAAILEAKGFTTHVSLAGPDNGVDILASRGALGFESPRICVQVKSQDSPIERTVHDQLIGAMKNHKADYGLLVAWGGFKSSITKEEASHFFEVRLWTHREVVEEFLRHYEELPEEIREAIPLKRVWVMDKSIIQ